ncbi:calcium binding protein [Anaeramoeba flamelloides]|uniref:Calcium binding protein n=1 Tax=Anaeramoeba flamelloides TaxID=1746091 RepID=A0ABQ8Y7E4_9EUKA|nr:calcium binding protein [Anaeramoeba flamelloides]
MSGYKLNKQQISSLEKKIKKLKGVKASKCHLNANDLEQLFDLDSDGAQSLLNALDLDNNGTVEWKELISGISILSSDSMDEKAKLLFDVWDADGNGVLDRDEIKQMFVSMFTLAATLSICDKFEQVKQNVGEEFNREDFETRKQIRMSLKIKGDLEEAVDDFFKKVDTDKNGSISLDEFKNYCKTEPQSLSSFERKLEELLGTSAGKACSLM